MADRQHLGHRDTDDRINGILSLSIFHRPISTSVGETLWLKQIHQAAPNDKAVSPELPFLFGAVLIADGQQFHILRGYIYFALAFAALVEMLNVLAHR